ncbi:hypothetical protein WME89_32745 [Sorangium sp. So ce321]|uniref:hypothetical protein n=1 Tax=Sorangium sp. So ce321 TaxID=3133300 RepID=UPI003F5E861A
MSERRSQVDDFTRLTEETERLAKHVEDLRLRIAATTARRRASSGRLPAQSGAAFEATHGSPTERPPHGPPSDRPPHGALSDRPPHGALSDRPPHGALSDRPAHDAGSERPHDAAPERTHDAGAERPHDGATEAAPERPQPRHSPFPERPSCLASVSRWLPPLRPTRTAMESGVHERVGEAGRYCIVTPRKKASAVPPRRRTPKADVA